jgi:hypothetical protein
MKTHWMIKTHMGIRKDGKTRVHRYKLSGLTIAMIRSGFGSRRRCIQKENGNFTVMRSSRHGYQLYLPHLSMHVLAVAGSDLELVAVLQSDMRTSRLSTKRKAIASRKRASKKISRISRSSFSRTRGGLEPKRTAAVYVSFCLAEFAILFAFGTRGKLSMHMLGTQSSPR